MPEKDIDSKLQELLELTEPLTKRELLIAQKAAELAAEIAVKRVTDNFYKDVGRTVVSRWLIIIGAAAVAFAAGKGWVRLS